MTERDQSILAGLLVSCGFAGLARCVGYMPIGIIEARVNDALLRHPYAEGRVEGREWFRLSALKQVFRSIRKPINSDEDWLDYLGRAMVA